MRRMATRPITLEHLKAARPRVDATFEPSTWDEATRSIDVRFYSGAAVRRYSYEDGDYLLSFKLEGADLSRYNGGAAVLKDHADYTSDAVIGKTMEGTARLEKDGAKVRVQFSADPTLAAFVEDVKAGIRKNWSMGTEIDAFEYLSKRGVAGATDTHIQVTAWTPYELSNVPVPADPGAQTLSREHIMQTQEQIDAAIAAAKAEGERLGAEKARRDAEAEAQRRTQILGMRPMFDHLGVEGGADFVQALADDASVSVHAAREKVLAKLDEHSRATVLGSAGRVKVGAQLNGKAGQVLAKAMAIKMGATSIKLTAEEESLVPGHISARRLCEDFLRRKGVQFSNLSDEEIVGRAFARCNTVAALERYQDTFRRSERMGEITTDDLPIIFGSATTLLLYDAMQAAPSTYRAWCAQITMNDFRDIKVMDHSRFPDLEEIPESGVPIEGTVEEKGETVSLKEYGRRIKFSRRAIVNDRWDLIGSVARSTGMRIPVKRNAVAYAKLVANPTLGQDSVAVFHSTHGNVGTSAAISATTLGELRKKIREQVGVKDKELSGMRLNLPMRVVAVGSALETTVEQLVSGLYVPTSATGVLPATMRNGLTFVADAEIASTTAHYGFADPAIAPCFAESVLGNEGVITDLVYDDDSKGVELSVRVAFNVQAVNFRGCAYNAGA